MKRHLLRLALALLLIPTRLFAALSIGDIAVIGLNCDPSTSLSKTFAIVVLNNLTAGEVIYFSDKSYYSGVFASPLILNGSDGRFSWTIPAGGVTKGTMIQFTITSGTTPSVTTNPAAGTTTVLEGWTSTSPTVSPFGINGDNLLIYQGTEASPTFIFGYNNGNATTGSTGGWNTGLSGNTNNSCEKPAILGTGNYSVGFGGTAHQDNFRYNGTRVGSKAALLTAIANTANWVSDDVTAYDLVPGGTIYAGSQPIFSMSTLPVKLVSFTAAAGAAATNLDWTVTDAVNFSHFVVEKGSSENNLTAIADIPGKNSSGAIKYHYSDPINTSSNTAFYRLRMVDLDGTWELSQVVAVKPVGATGAESVTVLSNPFSQALKLSANLHSRAMAGLQLTDLAGRVVYTKTMAIEKGITTLSLGEVDHLPPGNYFITINLGRDRFVRKVIKQ